MRNPYRILYFVAVAILALVSFASIVRATDGQTTDKVNICHRTASDTNPYVFISVDASALSPGHLDNADPGHKPTFWKSDGTFRGVAHLDGDAKDDYLASSEADCNDFVVETTPTPEPSVEPSVEPTPAPTSSLIPPVVVINTPTPEPVPNTAIAPEELSDGLAAGTILTLLGGTLLGLATLYLLSNKPYNGKRDE